MLRMLRSEIFPPPPDPLPFTFSTLTNKLVTRIKRLISLNRSKQPTVEDSAGIEDDNPLLSTRTNSSLSLKNDGASKAPSSLKTEASKSPVQPYSLDSDPSSSPSGIEETETEESIIFPGRSPRSSTHSGSDDDYVKIEHSDIPAPGEHEEASLREMGEEEKQALKLEEAEIMGRMDKELRTMLEKDRKKSAKDVWTDYVYLRRTG